MNFYTLPHQEVRYNYSKIYALPPDEVRYNSSKIYTLPHQEVRYRYTLPPDKENSKNFVKLMPTGKVLLYLTS